MLIATVLGVVDAKHRGAALIDLAVAAVLTATERFATSNVVLIQALTSLACLIGVSVRCVVDALTDCSTNRTRKRLNRLQPLIATVCSRLESECSGVALIVYVCRSRCAHWRA
jgi:hypothetical protein